jgi:hypothetical protein
VIKWFGYFGDFLDIFGAKSGDPSVIESRSAGKTIEKVVDAGITRCSAQGFE